MEHLGPDDDLLRRAMPGIEHVTSASMQDEEQTKLYAFRDYIQRQQRLRVAIDGPDCISGSHPECNEIV